MVTILLELSKFLEKNKMAKLKINNITITLNEYLANHSRKRNLDNAIILWYRKKDQKNTSRTKEDWDRIIAKFYSE